MHYDFRRTRHNYRRSDDDFGMDFMPLMAIVFVTSAFGNNAADGCEKGKHTAQEQDFFHSYFVLVSAATLSGGRTLSHGV
jgi:hypothetical protein